MRADVCDPNDDAAFQRFKDALVALGAVQVDAAFAIGVDMIDLEIDGEKLAVFIDPWSVDVKGPRALVERLRRAMQT